MSWRTSWIAALTLPRMSSPRSRTWFGVVIGQVDDGVGLEGDPGERRAQAVVQFPAQLPTLLLASEVTLCCG